MLKKLFYFTVFTLSLGQFTAVSKSGGANVYLFDAVVIFYAFFGLYVLLVSRRPITIPKIYLPLILFTGIALISLLAKIYAYTPTEWFLSSFYLVRWFSYLVAGIVTYSLVLNKLLKFEDIVRAIVFSGVLISVVGFVQLIVLPDFTKLDPTLGWDPHQNRLASTFFDPNFVGGYLSICFAFVLNEFQNLKKAKNGINQTFSKLSLILLSFLFVFAIFLTFSRSAWAMLAVVIFVFGLFRYRLLLISAFLIAFLAYFAVPRVQTRLSGITDPADSAAFRLVSWENSTEIIKDNFVIGVGFNAYRYAQLDYGFFEVNSTGGNSGAGSDSSFLFVLATTGIFGFLAFASSYFAKALKSLHENPYNLVILSVFAGIFLQSQFINALFYPQIMFVLFLLYFL